MTIALSHAMLMSIKISYLFCIQFKKLFHKKFILYFKRIQENSFPLRSTSRHFAPQAFEEKLVSLEIKKIIQTK